MIHIRYKAKLFPVNVPGALSWYRTPQVKFEIIRSHYKRETALIVSKAHPSMANRTLRMLRVHNVADLEYHMGQTKLFKHSVPYNIYYSLAEYRNGIPKGEPRYNMRDWTEWNATHHKHMTGYDLLIDFDSEGGEYLEEVYNGLLFLKRHLDKKNVPHEVRYSGLGFHVIIPHRYLPVMSFSPFEKDRPTMYDFCQNFGNYIKDHFSGLVDTGIYDSRRVVKTPYSLALYKYDVFVCHPFHSKEELERFNYEDYRLENYKVSIRGRGTHVFNKEGNIDGVKQWGTRN